MKFLRSLALAATVAAAAALPHADAQPAAAYRYEGLPAEAYVVVAQIRAKKGKEGELRAATLPLVAAVRAEPGNLLYFLHEDRESPGHFVFYEIFVNKAAFETHQATAHVQTWFARLPELAEGNVNITRIGLLNNTPGRR